LNTNSQKATSEKTEHTRQKQFAKIVKEHTLNIVAEGITILLVRIAETRKQKKGAKMLHGGLGLHNTKLYE
jgi:hypothetical protein